MGELEEEREERVEGITSTTSFQRVNGEIEGERVGKKEGLTEIEGESEGKKDGLGIITGG